MSDTNDHAISVVLRQRGKAAARRALQWHVPVGRLGRPFFAALYRFHVTARSSAAYLARLMWYEPLFRSQCRHVGERFTMEQLPYMYGRGEIWIGDGVRFSGKPSILFSSKYGSVPSLRIGDRSFLGHNVSINVARDVTIGSDCLIAGNVRISDFDGHPLDASARRDGQPGEVDSVHPVCIGDDVWVGHSAMVLKGVRIGDRAVIGARAVVTRDVPADSVVAGNPARVLRSIQAA